jgi:hypothetical protein
MKTHERDLSLPFILLNHPLADSTPPSPKPNPRFVIDAIDPISDVIKAGLHFGLTI